MLWHEEKARDLARQHNLPLAPLEETVSKSYENLFSAYLIKIREGHFYYERKARALAESRGYPLDLVEDALSDGHERKQSR